MMKKMDCVHNVGRLNLKKLYSTSQWIALNHFVTYYVVHNRLTSDEKIRLLDTYKEFIKKYVDDNDDTETDRREITKRI